MRFILVGSYMQVGPDKWMPRAQGASLFASDDVATTDRGIRELKGDKTFRVEVDIPEPGRND